MVEETPPENDFIGCAVEGAQVEDCLDGRRHAHDECIRHDGPNRVIHRRNPHRKERLRHGDEAARSL